MSQQKKCGICTFLKRTNILKGICWNPESPDYMFDKKNDSKPCAKFYSSIKNLQEWQEPIKKE